MASQNCPILGGTGTDSLRQVTKACTAVMATFCTSRVSKTPSFMATLGKGSGRVAQWLRFTVAEQEIGGSIPPPATHWFPFSCCTDLTQSIRVANWSGYKSGAPSTGNPRHKVGSLSRGVENLSVCASSSASWTMHTCTGLCSLG